MFLKKRETYFVSPVYIIAVCPKGTKVAHAVLSRVVMIVMELCSYIEGDQLHWAVGEVVTATRCVIR